MHESPQRRPTVGGRVASAIVALLVLGLLPLAGSAPAAAAPDEESCFVVRVHEIFLDRSATASEVSWWTAAFDAGTPRSDLPDALANSDEWLTVEVTELYQQALDRGPDPQGLAFWIDQLRRGAKVNRVGSLIYGSGEFYAQAGGTDEDFVTALYARILHRSPDESGLAYWVGEVDARGRARVADRFFASEESRRDRVTRLYDEILGRAPDAEGLAFWVERLQTVNDVRLAVLLASGGELFARAQQGCVLPPPDVVTFIGHGWGHGRGMGQYGALGYAIDHGWTGGQILDHFYGGTVAETQPSAPTQRVFLVESEDEEMIVTQDARLLRVDGYGADVGAVRVARLGANTFRVWRSATVGCGGPWTLVGDRTGEVQVRSNGAQGDDAARMLQHCVDDGTRYYRGSLRAVDAPGRGIVTVNEVGTEDMLRSVVPTEMPASWGDLAGGAGGAALRSQAVAARSYALAGDTRWGAWATTCDTTTCQAYDGFGFRPRGSATVERAEFPQSDLAVLATARQVRRWLGGDVARTEFSSSTGGWTAGGDFPAVIDEGDDTSRNSRHTWTTDVTRPAIEAAFDQRQGRDMGVFLGFDSYARNGLGNLGGRVLSVRARFSGGDVTVTGNQLRSLLRLNSDWFVASAPA